MPDLDRALRAAEDCLAQIPPDVVGARRMADQITLETAFYDARWRTGEQARFRDVIRGILSISDGERATTETEYKS